MYGAKDPIQEKRVGVKVHNVGDIKCHFLTWNWKQRLGRGSTPVCVHQPGKHGKGKELVPIQKFYVQLLSKMAKQIDNFMFVCSCELSEQFILHVLSHEAFLRRVFDKIVPNQKYKDYFIQLTFFRDFCWHRPTFS